MPHRPQVNRTGYDNLYGSLASGRGNGTTPLSFDKMQAPRDPNRESVFTRPDPQAQPRRAQPYGGAFDRKPSYGNDRPSYGNDRSSYGNDRSAQSFDRQSSFDRPQRSFDRPQFNDRPQYNDRQQSFDRPQRSFDRPQYSDRPQRGMRDDHDRRGSDAYNATNQSNDGPTASRFTAVDEVVTREKLADAKFEKRNAGRQKDRARTRQFDEEESGILEEDESGLSAKEAKKKKKEAKRMARAPKALIPIILPQFISVENLATLLHVRVEHFTKQMREMGFEDTSNDHILNAETAGLIAGEFGYDPITERDDNQDIKPRPAVEDKSALPARPPVVTIMGHVDHGKTTLLDWLRKSSIVDTEHGGITQHIGAFSVTMPSGKLITFLDTPGHAAFLNMRARGANVTDIVILVVAADDSVKPQTIEAIKHAKSAGVPIIVAINKIDKDGANAEKVKGDLARFGVDVEDYGGDTQVVLVSGKTGLGMESLEETVLTLSEILDHRAEDDGPVEGWVLEATVKKKGQVATVLVTRGTLTPGTILVAGTNWTRVRTLTNEHGQLVDSAGPGTPIEVDGWRGPPEAGSQTLAAPTEDAAKTAIEYREAQADRIQAALDMDAINASRREHQLRQETESSVRAAAKLAGENPVHAVLAAERIAAEEAAVGKTKEIPFIVKADVSGSVEAVVDTILPLGNAEVKAKIILSNFGAVGESDIDHAAASGARIITFNLPADPTILAYARAKKVEILEHNIIYALTADITSILETYLPPKITFNVTSEADVLQIFSITAVKGGKKCQVTVAGCKVKTGAVGRRDKVRVMRGKEQVWQGTLESLKVVKKDMSEVKKGSECGIGFEGWAGVEAGDRVQSVVEVREVRTFYN